MVAETGEVLAGKLRTRKAGANTTEDHVTVLADAIAQLPERWRSGQGRGDDDSQVEHRVVVRADSAAASHWLTEECRDHNLGFSIGHRIDGSVRDALVCIDDESWSPARDGNGDTRDGAEVVEITGLIDLTAWPTGTLMIVRRERPHEEKHVYLARRISFEPTPPVGPMSAYTPPLVACAELTRSPDARVTASVVAPELSTKKIEVLSEVSRRTRAVETDPML